MLVLKKKTIFSFLIFFGFFITQAQISENTSNPAFEQLIGTWKIDLSPGNPTANNFTEMNIKKISTDGVKGTFYYTEMEFGEIAQYEGAIHFAFVTQDGSTDYNTTAVFKDGKLMGTTHAVGREFLSVWVAEKIK